MKIAICSKKDLGGCLSLNRLLDGLSGRHELFVMLSDYVLEAEKDNAHAALLVAHERDMVLEHIFPFLDGLYPHGSDAVQQTYAGLAARYGVPMQLWGSIRSPQAFSALQEFAPDIVISCRYDYIFHAEAIALPQLGIYGLHPGALPALQGLCSPFRAMERGDKRSGCTLFHVDVGLDTGPIVDIGWHDIDCSRSLLWNFIHTYFAGIDAFMEHLPKLEAGSKLAGVTQNAHDRQYYTYPSAEEFEAFTRMGGNLVTREDYLEILSWFLPGGRQNPHMPALAELVASLNC